LQQFSVSSYLSIPEEPGIYEFFNLLEELLYVGKAKNLRNRVSSYFQKGSQLHGKTAILVPQVKKIKIITVESELEALLLEAHLIKKYNPKYNMRLTDGKAYPLIRVTSKDKYPAVITARLPVDKKSVYFGPFPSSATVRNVLRLIRRIFPYQSTLNHPNRLCLYNHLGLCPCLNAKESEDNRKMYKNTIHHIVNFLEGDSGKVLRELKKERDFFAKKELFENASKIQKQINQILYITQASHNVFEYETNPNFKSDQRTEEMRELKKVLSVNGIEINLPRRVECFDNSNIQGTNPTSSMVVLTNGEVDKSQYRKFKIKKVKGANDFATMQEVLSRRLKHKEWPMPDLFIVDGGKGQVSAARGILEPNIPLIGIAKREEIIITSDLREIKLSKSSPALRLVMRIRDEAHRFAISYHRKLRNKNLLNN